jgi:hypothetical protein
MCTVTFVPVNDRYFITSNRDEKMMRKPAIPPQCYPIKNTILLYPKDADAGGAWIAMNDKGNAAVLLNGAFIKHVSIHPYQRSRGLVLLDIISAALPIKYFFRLDLAAVEPFTLIILEQDSLYECRWDGSSKYGRQLPKHRSHIWSSVTLYTDEIIRKREQWFARWLNNHLHPTLEDIRRFHQFGGEGDPANDLLMNRDKQMLTVSITGMEIWKDRGRLVYTDCKACKTYEQEMPFISQLAVQ